MKQSSAYNKHGNPYEAGMSYSTYGENQDDDKSANRNNQRKGGRRGRGGGRGGGRFNAGCGRGNGRVGRGADQPTQHRKTENEVHPLADDDQESEKEIGSCNDNSKNTGTYSPTSSNNNPACYNISRAQHLCTKPNLSLVIDSALMSDIIGCTALAHDIHEAQAPLDIKSINGSSTIHKQAYMGAYPPLVWLHKPGGVNILSLNNVQKYYRCTLDTDIDNAIYIHLKNGKKYDLKPPNGDYTNMTLKNPKQ